MLSSTKSEKECNPTCNKIIKRLTQDRRWSRVRRGQPPGQQSPESHAASLAEALNRTQMSSTIQICLMYSILILVHPLFYGNFGFLHMGPKSFEFCSIIKDHRVPGIRSVMRQCHEQSVAFLWWTSKNNQNGAPYNEPQISFFPGYWYKYRYTFTMVPNMHLEKRPDWPGTAWIAWSLNLWALCTFAWTILNISRSPGPWRALDSVFLNRGALDTWILFHLHATDVDECRRVGPANNGKN